MKTFEFTESDRIAMIPFVESFFNGIPDYKILFDRIEQIVSERIAPEPGESGHSAEDVLKGLLNRGMYEFSYSANECLQAMRTYASQVCADKDREIVGLNNVVSTMYAKSVDESRITMQLESELSASKQRISELEDEKEIMINFDRDKCIVYDEMAASLEFANNRIKELSNSVRPEVVVPSEKKDRNDYEAGWNRCLDVIKDINPTITFTELNHEK